MECMQNAWKILEIVREALHLLCTVWGEVCHYHKYLCSAKLWNACNGFEKRTGMLTTAWKRAQFRIHSVCPIQTDTMGRIVAIQQVTEDRTVHAGIARLVVRPQYDRG